MPRKAKSAAAGKQQRTIATTEEAAFHSNASASAPLTKKVRIAPIQDPSAATIAAAAACKMLAVSLLHSRATHETHMQHTVLPTKVTHHNRRAD
jgi:hypothetical protein